ncbi:MAG TPA: SMR family transporter [Patescibacteria group bacterium]|nr:SMR family transporter [Patescibacteria group bacterium]
MSFIQFLEILLIAIANVAAQVFLKKADAQTFGWEMVTNKFVWAGALLYISAFWVWVKIINQMEMSTAVPLMAGIMYALTLVASWYFFKEQITLIKVLGVFLILLGIFFLTKKF